MKLLQETTQVTTGVEILRLEDVHNLLKAGGVYMRVR